MTASPVGNSEPHHNYLVTTAWLVLGVLAYRYASLAMGGAVNARTLLPLFMALAMGSPTLAMALVASFGPLFPALGYVAIRYWVLPARPQSWRGAVALPLIVLPCMVVASVASALVASLSLVALPFLSALLGQVLVMLLTGLLAGACLYGIERTTTRLFFGPAEAAKLGGSLCFAHAIGFAVVLLAGSLPVTLGIHVFHTAVTQTLVLPILVCGELVHLPLAWRAWQSRAPLTKLNPVGVACGIVLGFVVLSLIGAVARAPQSAAPPALTWPLSSNRHGRHA